MDRIKAAKDELIAQIREIEPEYKIEDNSDIEIEYYNGEDILNTDFPERKYILDPWLPEQGIVMIHAKAGTGKTYFTLSAAIAISLGKDFIMWKCPSPKRVLYIDGEMQGRKIKSRLKQLLMMFPAYSKELFRENFWMITPGKMKRDIPMLSTPEGQDYINRYIINKKIDVVIVDNVSCLMGAIKENDADSWNVIQQWELKLRKMGTSVIRIQHTGKSKSHRGSSKHQDIVDTTIFLEQPEDGEKFAGARFIVHFEKHRDFYGSDTDSFEIKLRDDAVIGVCWESQSFQESIEKRVVACFLENMSYKEIQIECEINFSRISRILQDARTNGLIEARDIIEYKRTNPKCRIK